MEVNMRIPLLFPLAIGLLLAAAPGFAQADLKASVPFGFYAGNNGLPAGTYKLDLDNSGMVWIHREDRRGRAVVSTVGIGGSDFERESKLVFHRYGDEYFLTELWVSGRSTGRKFGRTPREGRIARNTTGGEVTILASSP
jgi:hypothetical protein